MTLKHLVLALAVAAACVAPSSPRGSTEAVGDTFEMSKAVAKNDATLAGILTPKLRGAAEGHSPPAHCARPHKSEGTKRRFLV